VNAQGDGWGAPGAPGDSNADSLGFQATSYSQVRGALASLGPSCPPADPRRGRPGRRGPWAPADRRKSLDTYTSRGICDPNSNPRRAQDVSGRLGQSQEQPKPSTSGAFGAPPPPPQQPPQAPGGAAADPQGGGGGGGGWLSVERYRKAFDVDDEEVGKRILAATVFFWRRDFIEAAHENPDLYGPFWVASTLIFLVSAMSNIVSWANFRAAGGADGGDVWYLDTDKALLSIILLYGYVSLVPAVVWGAFKFLGASLSLVQSVNIMGYSLALFVPVGVLCAVPLAWLQWLLVLAAFGSTGWFLVSNLTSHIQQAAAGLETRMQGRLSATRLKLIVSATCLSFHLFLALCLKLYFFRYTGGGPSPADTPGPETPAPSPETPGPSPAA